MPNKRSFHYHGESIQKDRKRRSLAALKKIYSYQVPSGGLIVTWVYHQPLNYSAKQWELFTSALCQEGALYDGRNPGPIIHEHPSLTVEIEKIESFEKFCRYALLNPSKHDLQVRFVRSNTECAVCLIEKAQRKPRDAELTCQ